MQTKKAIVIGSGVAGMAVAIRLATDGFETSVYEKNDYPGGKLSYFEKAGFRFDRGPSLFTQPTHIEDIFNYANIPIEKYFSYQPVDIACHYFFANGKRVLAYTDTHQFAQELHSQLNENPRAVTDYLQRADNLYNKVGHIFLNHSLHKAGTWFQSHTIEALRTVGLGDLFSSLHRSNKKHFQTAEAVQLFNRYATYNGSNPYQAPGMLRMIPHLEMNEGTFYPKGGMISITQALYHLALDKGVRFHFNHPVEKIYTKGNQVTGIETDGKSIDADVVISNGDVYYTYRHLLNDTKRAAKIARTERSSSALIFYWGIEKRFTELGLHNILFSDAYKEEFTHIFKHKTLYHDPTVYINITSKMESHHAPEGCENWFVMINAPVQEGQDWTEMKNTARKNIISKVNKILSCDIEQHISTETVLDPVGIFNNTGTYKGALYGTSSNSKWSAFLRPANFSKEWKGLYFCGGTVHPGGGIPLCLKSAEITSTIIRNDYQQ